MEIVKLLKLWLPNTRSRHNDHDQLLPADAGAYTGTCWHERPAVLPARVQDAVHACATPEQRGRLPLGVQCIFASRAHARSLLLFLALSFYVWRVFFVLALSIRVCVHLCAVLFSMQVMLRVHCA